MNEDRNNADGREAIAGNVFKPTQAARHAENMGRRPIAGRSQWLRYLIAIVVSQAATQGVLVNLLGLLLDIVWGREIVGGVWPINIASVALWTVDGWAVGWIAGWIAGRRGRVISVVAMTAPLLLIVLVGVTLQLDFARISTALRFEVLSLTLGILPAYFGGKVAVDAKPLGLSSSLRVLVGVLLAVISFAAVALHLWTVALTWQAIGPPAAAVALAFPLAAEAYWLIRAMGDTHHFLNFYSMRVLLIPEVGVVTMVIAIIADRIRPLPSSLPEMLIR